MSGKRPDGGLLTLAALARAKQLPEEFLAQLGLHDTAQGVAIPYLDGSGNVLFERIRRSLDGERRFRQPTGVPLMPYGLDRLKDARQSGFVVMVEGESDSWTLWRAGIAALGLPGASTAGKLERGHLQGIDKIFAVREPGRGGDTFISGIANRIHEIGFTGEAYEISLDGFKDPSDLFCDDPSAFFGRFETILNHAQILACNSPPDAQRCTGFQPLDDYLATAELRREKKAYWSGILRAGEISLLAGRAMAGKSTFACALARALMTIGMPLLGRECLTARVGYMALERNGSAVAELLQKWGVEPIWFLDELPAMGGQELAAFLQEQINRHGLEVIIVDHLQNLVRVADANDYARVSLALEPFLKVAKRTAAHLILLHHQGKTRREGEIDVMGSEAFRAASDVIIEATRGEGRHYIRANIRGEADLPRMQVNVNLETGDVDASNALQVETGNALAAIIEFLNEKDEWQKGSAIREGIGLKQQLVTDALKAGVTDGKILQRGGGRKGDPYHYQTAEFVSDYREGKAGNESAHEPESQLRQ